jgi:hypothetical protein
LLARRRGGRAIDQPNDDVLAIAVMAISGGGNGFIVSMSVMAACASPKP